MIQIDHLHVTTDGPLSETQVRSLGATLAGGIQAALKAAGTAAPQVHVRELRLNGPLGALRDRPAQVESARSVARRLLDRTPD
jgi:hypothetical protein